VRDWTSSLTRIWNEATGQRLTKENCNRWELADVYKHPTVDAAKLAFDTHVAQLHSGAAEIEVAREAVCALSDKGVDIILISDQPNYRTQVSTLGWLFQHSIPYKEIHFTGRKDLVDCDLWLDDGPHVIQQLQEAGLPYIIFDQPYNQGSEGNRVKNWEEAREGILSFKDTIEAWLNS